MSRATLVVLSGISFAGKSTLATALGAALPATVISLDEINAERGIHGGDGIPVDEWVTTNGIARERAAAFLAAGITVVIDDTTSRRFLRDEWRSLAESVGTRSILVWVVIAPDAQRQRVEFNRREQNRRDVIDTVMAEHLSTFESPEEDEGALVVDSALPIEQQVAIVAASLDA